METTQKINWARIDNDTSGNPRYVCHFLGLTKDGDEAMIRQDFAASLAQKPHLFLDFLYDLAMDRARKLGGRKYNTKKYGGGIVFQSYNIPDLEQRIKALLA